MKFQQLKYFLRNILINIILIKRSGRAKKRLKVLFDVVVSWHWRLTLTYAGCFSRMRSATFFETYREGERGKKMTSEIQKEKRVKRHFDVLPKCHPTKTVWAASSCHWGWGKNNNHWSLYLQHNAARAFSKCLPLPVSFHSVSFSSITQKSLFSLFPLCLLMFSPLCLLQFDSELK